MLMYSVTVYVDRDCEEKWRHWMAETHIGDVMATGCFEGARFYRLTEGEGDRAGYRIDYQCADESRYREYAAQYAAALQKDHAERFAGRCRADRAIGALIRGY